jgi:hypothetical protein
MTRNERLGCMASDHSPQVAKALRSSTTSPKSAALFPLSISRSIPACQIHLRVPKDVGIARRRLCGIALCASPIIDDETLSSCLCNNRALYTFLSFSCHIKVIANTF